MLRKAIKVMFSSITDELFQYIKLRVDRAGVCVFSGKKRHSVTEPNSVISAELRPGSFGRNHRIGIHHRMPSLRREDTHASALSTQCLVC